MSNAGRKQSFVSFPPFDRSDKEHEQTKRDSILDFGVDHDFDSNTAMAGAGSPYIKSEPNDFNFDPNQYMQYNRGSHSSQFGSGNMNVDPANLAYGSHGMSQNFGQSSGNNGFTMTGASITDDELLDLDFNNNQQQSTTADFGSGLQHFLQQQSLNQSVFSNTPDGAPIQSPFNTNEFNYAGFRPMDGQFIGAQSMPQQAMRSQAQHLDRKFSDPRSPATPKTPGLSNLQMSDEMSNPRVQQIHRQRQQSSMGNGWDSTSSHHSLNESSPFPSPSNGQPMHNAISEVLRNGPQQHHKVGSSLPAKMEASSGIQSQEAKRRRRRESHNQVERRRRDNINERIHDLGELVPQHRLEDEKVRKHLQTNAPLSPSIANAGLSPPNASSMLSGAQSRRTTSTGNITQGLPMEEKDKGPNKGDILNGSVAWTRDLMWYMQRKLQQEEQLKKLVQQLGGSWPFEQGEEEKRMHGEICEIINKHSGAGRQAFSGYSRGPGSGLRVPGFTNVAGESLNADGQVVNMSSQQQSLSPGFQAGGSGMNSGNLWNGDFKDFKEEDEFTMEMQ